MGYQHSVTHDSRRGIIGLMLALLGLGLLLGNWGLLPHIHVWRFAGPAALIAIGGARLLTPRADGRAHRGAGLVALGVILLLANLNMWSLRESWPLLLVVGGLSMVWKGATRRARITEGGIR